MKNIQKEKKNKITVEEKANYFKFVTTLAILLLAFVVTYFLIGLFYTKEIDFNKKDDKKEEVTIDNDTIMLSQLLEQSNENYYVLIYDVSDKTSSIDSWLSVYKSKSEALNVYKVDSNKKFNAKYLSDESNPNPTGLSDLKVKAPTLIKVSNKAIAEYIEGEEAITNVFKNN